MAGEAKGPGRPAKVSKHRSGVKLEIILVVITIIAVGAIVFSLSKSVTAQGIGIMPPSQSVQVGSTFDVDIFITGQTDVKGFQADVSYDPQILELVEVYEGEYLKSDGRETFFVSPDTSTSGKAEGIAAVILRAGSGIEGGEGVLATATFVAKAQGTSPIYLTNVKVANSARQEISITVTDGFIQVY